MALYEYHICGDTSRADEIRQGIEDKADRMILRDLYRRARQGDEAARQEYLRRTGARTEEENEQ